MNPLVILLGVIIALALIAAVLAPIFWAIFLLIGRDDGAPIPWRRLAAATGALALAITATIWVGSTFLTDDSAAHCGPGTHYLETGSGKTRSWLCVAS
jgi:hypothetical protein